MLHIYCHEFVANLWRMFCIVCKAELFFLHSITKFGVFLDLDIFTFNFLVPSKFVKTFAEEDCVGEYDLIEGVINSLRDAVQVQSKYLIDEHHLTVIVRKDVVVATP